jgi:hypothetical protein
MEDNYLTAMNPWLHCVFVNNELVGLEKALPAAKGGGRGYGRPGAA